MATRFRTLQAAQQERQDAPGISKNRILYGDYYYWVMAISLGILPILKNIIGKYPHLALDALNPMLMFTWMAARHGLRRKKVDDMTILYYGMIVIGIEALFVGLINRNTPRYIAKDFQIGYCLFIITMMAAKGTPGEMKKYFTALSIPLVAHLIAGIPHLYSEPGNRQLFFAMGEYKSQNIPSYLDFTASAPAIGIFSSMGFRQQTLSGKILSLMCLSLAIIYTFFSLTRTLGIALIIPFLILLSANSLKKSLKLKTILLLIIWSIMIIVIPPLIFNRFKERAEGDSVSDLNGRIPEISGLFAQMDLEKETITGRGLGGVFCGRGGLLKIGFAIVPHIEFFWCFIKAGWPGLIFGILGLLVFFRRASKGFWKNPAVFCAFLSLFFANFSGGALQAYSLFVMLGISMSFSNTGSF